MTAATSVGRSVFMSRTRGRAAVIGRGAGVDLGMTLVFTALALLPWMTTFDGSRYLAVGLGGALFGLLAGVVGVARGRVWIAVASLPLIYVLVAGMLVGGSVVPSGAALLRGIRLPVTGWKNLLTTVPPVDSTGPLVVLPFLLGLVAAAAAFVLARRSPGPWTPVVPGVVLGILTVLTGARGGWHPLVAGFGLAAAAVSWAALRRRRRLRIVGTGAGARAQIAVAAALLALAGAGSWALAPLLPGVDRGRFLARDVVEPPFAVDQYPSPLLGYRKYGASMKLVHDEALFGVTGLSSGARVRLAVLDYYTGSVWSAGSGTPGTGGVFQRVGRTIRVDTPGDAPTATATLTIRPAFADLPELTPWVPGVGPWSRISFGGPRAADLRSSLRYNTDSGQGLVPVRLRPGDVVTVTGTVVTDLDVTKGGFRPATGDLLDAESTAFVAATAQKWVDDDSTHPPLAALAARLKNYVRTFTDGGLNLDKTGYLPGHGAVRIARFLSAKQGSPDSFGSDEQFAAAYALMANAIGIPARVVLGAVVPDGGVVMGRDVRAWVEVEGQSGQWFAVPNSAFEPKPGDTPQLDSDHEVSITDPVLVPPAAGQPAPGTSDSLSDADPGAFRPATSGGGAIGDPGPRLGVPTWVRTSARYAVPPTGALAAVALVAGAARGIRRRRRRTVGVASRRLAAGWRDLTDHARDLGLVVPVAATRLEQARVVGHEGLAAAADRAVFGAGDPAPGLVEAYWTQVRSARRALSRGVPWHRRLLRAWSPRSFFVPDPLVEPRPPRRPGRRLTALVTRRSAA